MELMYPVVIFVCLTFLIVTLFFNIKKKSKYSSGKRVANTRYIKETEYYKSKVKKYKILSKMIMCISALSIMIGSIMISRPVTIQNKSEEKYNRDIIIGLDVSTSECEVNLNLVKKFREIIPSIVGDRIGIVLFNTAPITYCPLTDDYDYIYECLNVIERQMQLVVDNNGYIPFKTIGDDEAEEINAFWYGGTIANNDERGSSLIGDGLAGSVFAFPDVKTDTSRTRIILFATDNALSGTEAVTLDEACTLCKKYNINLYAYCPTVEMNIYASKKGIASYKNAVEENAGGKFYNGDINELSTTIVNEIKETKTSLLKTSKKTIITDHPEASLICILILFLILIVLEKRVKL